MHGHGRMDNRLWGDGVEWGGGVEPRWGRSRTRRQGEGRGFSKFFSGGRQPRVAATTSS